MREIIDGLKIVFGIGGALLVGLVIGLFLIVQFPQLKLVVSSFFAFFGGAGKWFRRKALETEVEGTMNSFSRAFNRNYSFDFLPECEVRWVTAENQASILRPGKAIIKLSFSRDDHDLNVYNAAQAYVETSFLPEAKPFLRRATSKAIDLMVIKMLLIQGRREALRIFNSKFNDHEENARVAYSKLEEADREGLFRRLFLPELHVFGLAVATKTPSETLQGETERFLNWFYELATRPPRELTKLYFEGENIRVGVILVADPETYAQFGIQAYLKRANLYATRNYQCIYVLARGKRGSDLAGTISRNLCGSGAYSQLTKETITTHGEGSDAYLATCIALRPDITSILFNAWRSLEEDYKAQRCVTGTVDIVTVDTVTVDVYGLKVEIPKDQLCSVAIGPAFRFFDKDQELELRILECVTADQFVRLSNCNTATDPKNIVEVLQQHAGQPVDGLVEAISRSRDYDVGWRLAATIGDRPVRAFLPRGGGTFSRFVSLEEKYPVGTKLRIVIERFNFEHAQFLCRLEKLTDPWESISDLTLGGKVSVRICEITENHATCEIREGLEARLFYAELSWDAPETNRQNMRGLKVGASLDAVICKIDAEHRYIAISVKRLTKSDTEAFYDEHHEHPVNAKVERVENQSAILQFEGGKAIGRLHVSNIVWGYCENLQDVAHVGETLKVKCLGYNSFADVIDVGIKQLEPNHFEDFKGHHPAGSVVECEVIHVGTQSIRTRTQFQGKQAFGYIHRAEVSSVFFVDDSTALSLFKPGVVYHCTVKRFDETYRIIEFSRKQYLSEELGRIEYGTTFRARLVQVRNQTFAYGDAIEGRIVSQTETRRAKRTEAEVMLARKGRTPRDVELSLA